MKTICLLLAVSTVLFLSAAQLSAAGYEAKTSGEELFREHCAACHPEGGNIINPRKTLHRKVLRANSIKSPAAIINKMRNPDTGMTRFDKTMISDSDALKIAEYILKTFQ